MVPPRIGLIRDGDFESYQFGTDWYANGGSLEFIDAPDAPSGGSYAKLTSRTARVNINFEKNIRKLIKLKKKYPKILDSLSSTTPCGQEQKLIVLFLTTQNPRT